MPGFQGRLIRQGFSKDFQTHPEEHLTDDVSGEVVVSVDREASSLSILVLHDGLEILRKDLVVGSQVKPEAPEISRKKERGSLYFGQSAQRNW